MELCPQARDVADAFPCAAAGVCVRSEDILMMIFIMH